VQFGGPAAPGATPGADRRDAAHQRLHRLAVVGVGSRARQRSAARPVR
jgi:hypothetical protein